MRALAKTTEALCLVLLSAGLAGPAAQAGGSEPWIVERDTAVPSYAAIAPSRTNLNIDTVVLACEQGADGRVLQLQLYLTDEGVLRRTDMPSPAPDGNERAEVDIDGRLLPVDLLFAEDHVVLADTQAGLFPALSASFLEALQRGTTLTLRVDLAGSPAESGFDGEAVVDLRAPGGPAAIAAMRRCASPDASPRPGPGRLAMRLPAHR